MKFNRNKEEITLVILLLITFMSSIAIIEAKSGYNGVLDGNQTNVVKHRRVKRFLSMRPGQRFLVRFLIICFFEKNL